jgi:hypothetical protein
MPTHVLWHRPKHMPIHPLFSDADRLRGFARSNDSADDPLAASPRAQARCISALPDIRMNCARPGVCSGRWRRRSSCAFSNAATRITGLRACTAMPAGEKGVRKKVSGTFGQAPVAAHGERTIMVPDTFSPTSKTQKATVSLLFMFPSHFRSSQSIAGARPA